MSRQQKGFSHIEWIIIITLIIIVASAVFVTVDPLLRLHASRNTARWSDVTNILEAVKKYQVDNDGDLPEPNGIDNDVNSIQIITSEDSTVNCATATCSITLSWPSEIGNLCTVSGMATALRPYLKDVPFDPKTGSRNDTRYYINKDAYGIISVGACDAEEDSFGVGGTAPTIEVTR